MGREEREKFQQSTETDEGGRERRPAALAGRRSDMARAASEDCCVHAIDHVKKLPDAEKARALLEECARHIKPLLVARGFRVLKVCAGQTRKRDVA